MMEIEEICKKYSARLKDRIGLLDGFTQATAKMKEALEAKDIRQINLHLKERQGIIDRIQNIDNEVDSFVHADGFSMDRVSGKAKDQLRGYFDRMRSTLESLSGTDKQCLQLAGDEHDRMKSEILTVQRGRRVARGYRPTCHQIPRFLDMKR